MQRNDNLNGQFRGNVLIVGKTRLWKNLLSIELTSTREAEIQSSFNYDVEFQYPQKLESFDDLIEFFKLKTIEDTDSIQKNEYHEDKKI